MLTRAARTWSTIRRYRKTVAVLRVPTATAGRAAGTRPVPDIPATDCRSGPLLSCQLACLAVVQMPGLQVGQVTAAPSSLAGEHLDVMEHALFLAHA